MARGRRNGRGGDPKGWLTTSCHFKVQGDYVGFGYISLHWANHIGETLDPCFKHRPNVALSTNFQCTLWHWANILPIVSVLAGTRGTPCDIDAIYASPKSTFSGLQLRCSQYGSIFIRLAVIASEKHEKCRAIPRDFDLTVVQGHRSWCQWKAHINH